MAKEREREKNVLTYCVERLEGIALPLFLVRKREKKEEVSRGNGRHRGWLKGGNRKVLSIGEMGCE